MDSAERETPDERLKREIEELRQRLEETAKKGRQVVQSLEVGPEGIWITDVRTANDIQFVAAFAAEHQLAMTYGKKSFYLSPEND